MLLQSLNFTWYLKKNSSSLHFESKIITFYYFHFESLPLFIFHILGHFQVKPGLNLGDPYFLPLVCYCLSLSIKVVLRSGTLSMLVRFFTLFDILFFNYWDILFPIEVFHVQNLSWTICHIQTTHHLLPFASLLSESYITFLLALT